jgi:anaerobic magnesium-protoporphyrin IX monomethyl ester cyclase
VAKVLFINPVVREEDVPRHIPYGIALLAAIAVKEGHQVQVYDANAWRLPDDVLAKVCAADKWDVVAIGGLTTTYGYIKRCMRIVREELPGVFIIAGGGFLTSMPLDIMKWLTQIDLGIVGEAFVTFPEVLAKIDRGERDFSQTLGVVYREPDGAPALTNERPIIDDLDSLPWPAWDLFPLEEVYFKNSSSLFSEEAYLAKRRIDVNASFGCGLICRYCWHLGTTGDMIVEKQADGTKDVVFTYGRHIRWHSPEYIVKMVRHLRDTYQVDFVNFLDENLMTVNASSKKTWLKALCEAWIEAGLQPKARREGREISAADAGDGVYWSGTSHATLHSPEILELMHRSGCTHLVYGLESFDPHILKNLGKGSTRDNNISSVDICLSSGIKPIPNIIIGFPEETFASIENTITALRQLGIFAKPHFATAYPGSEWYNTYKRSIIEQYGGDLESYILDLGDAQKITGIISHNFSAVELLGLQAIVHQRDLRLLRNAAEYWARSRSPDRPMYARPKVESNFKAVKLRGPIGGSLRRKAETGSV